MFTVRNGDSLNRVLNGVTLVAVICWVAAYGGLIHDILLGNHLRDTYSLMNLETLACLG